MVNKTAAIANLITYFGGMIGPIAGGAIIQKFGFRVMSDFIFIANLVFIAAYVPLAGILCCNKHTAQAEQRTMSI